MNRSTLVAVAVLSLFSGGCGAAETVDDAETQAREGPSGLYEANATVLDNGDDGPMLCLGTILTSLPPQCGDVPIANWDWNAVITGDAERHEDELRDLWGGPLCVTERETYTATELDEIRAEVEGEVLD